MPGPLTDIEKAEIRDHLGWSNQEFQTDYVWVWVNPTMDQLTDEAKLTIVRKHLATLNSIQEKMQVIHDDFDLKEVKGIVFDNTVEGRLWAQYYSWVVRLAASLSVEFNEAIWGGDDGDRDIV